MVRGRRSCGHHKAGREGVVATAGMAEDSPLGSFLPMSLFGGFYDHSGGATPEPSRSRGADAGRGGDGAAAAYPRALGIPLFGVDKLLAVQPRKPPPTTSPSSGGAPPPPQRSPSQTFFSDLFGGGVTGGGAQQEDAREFVAATCTSEVTARSGDAAPARTFVAAACSEEGLKHHLMLRAADSGAHNSNSGRAVCR